jgi:hypothetical protein
MTEKRIRIGIHKYNIKSVIFMTKKQIFFIKITSFIVVVTLLSATSVITQPLRSTFAVSTIESFNLPTGKYDGIFNGSNGQLNITSIDEEGVFNGTMNLMNLSTHIKGYFENVSDRITFVREIGLRPSDIEIYTGDVTKFNFSEPASCIFRDGRTICRGNNEFSCYDANDVANIKGTFVSFVEGNAKRNIFGWSATHELTAIPC